MPRQRLPLQIDGAKKTEIMERVITERLGMLKERALRAYPDGIIAGMKKQTDRQMFDRIIVKMQGADWPLIMDPDYLAKYQAGVAPAPLSSYWLTLMSVPDSFVKIQRGFIKTYEDLAK